MRITFLCGSLELGRDGVGDYVRRLSGELFKQGHYISIIALNDYYVGESVFSNQISENVAIPILRLPSVWNTTNSLSQAKQWIDEFNPDWVSLQFVPFAFHTKGLPFFLGRKLHNLGVGRHWHIMFHELWVGMNAESSTKIQLWGKCQKYLIRLLINKLKPKAIHTQSSLYQSQLNSLGYHSNLLPLFANIPHSFKFREKIHDSTHVTPSQIPNVRLVIFGTIHPNAPVELLASEAALYSKQHISIVTLITVGRCGVEQDRWVRAWQAVGLPVNVLGEQPPEVISNILQSASLGISTTPLAQIEKSGTVAAMLEHGLSVICVSTRWTPMGVAPPQIPVGIFAYTRGNFEKYLKMKPISNSSNKASDIAKLFLDSLSI